jgi:hypothetical protein
MFEKTGNYTPRGFDPDHIAAARDDENAGMDTMVTDQVRTEHEALRATLKRAMREPGKTGEAARELAGVADGHFLREEKFVAPLLALLPRLARGEAGAHAAKAPKMANELRRELEQMIDEHRLMAEQLREFLTAAQAEGHEDYVSFAEEFMLHSRLEEQVLYPAALVAGEYVNLLRK